MRSFSMPPTDENVSNTLQNNFLGRNSGIVSLIRLLNTVDEGFSIALDAQWGDGKTFFVKQANLLLDALNPHIKMDENLRQSIAPLWKKYQPNGSDIVEPQPMVALYYDAWENDNDEDPVLSLAASIAAEYGRKTGEIPTLSKGKGQGIGKTLVAIAGAVVNRDLNSIHAALSGDNVLDHLERSRWLKNAVASFFRELPLEKGNRLVLFIDELDRCKPSFAVQLLERIKHYFCEAPISFVFSVNLQELQHTIRKHYGEEIDASQYLGRFFDVRTTLPEANLSQFFKKMDFQYNEYKYEWYCKFVAEYYKFSLRDIERFYSEAKTLGGKVVHSGQHGALFFATEKTVCWALRFVVPVVIACRIRDINSYRNFITGKDANPLLEIMRASDKGTDWCGELLEKGEQYAGTNPQTLKTVTLEDKLHQVYHAIYIAEYQYPDREIKVGELRFDKETSQQIREASGALSVFADYSL